MDFSFYVHSCSSLVYHEKLQEKEKNPIQESDNRLLCICLDIFLLEKSAALGTRQCPPTWKGGRSGKW